MVQWLTIYWVWLRRCFFSLAVCQTEMSISEVNYLYKHQELDNC